MPITNKTDLISYAKRRLGEPVIKVNIDTTQATDRVDDALEYYRDYHFNALARRYKKYTVSQADIDNRFITLPDNIQSVVRIVNANPVSGTGMFDVNYQYALDKLSDMSSFDLVDLTMMDQHIQMINKFFEKGQVFEYERHTDQLRLFVDWDAMEADVSVIVVECYEYIDEDTFTGIFNDRWLKRYVTALIKKQWGDNMKKMEGVQLPGGVTLNGQKIYDEAVAEISELEAEMINGYSDPVDFFVA